MATTAFAAAGFDNVQWSLRSDSGYIIGPDGLTASDTGTASDMARLLAAQAAPIVVNQPVIVNIPGDNTSKYQFLFESTDLPQFQLTTGVNDLVFRAAATGTSIYELGDWRMLGNSQPSAALVPMTLLLSRNAGELPSGDPVWEHVLILNAQVRFLGGGFTTQGEAAFNYQVILNKTDTFVDGRTITSVLGTAEEDHITWTSANRVSLTSFVGDNAIAAVPVAYPPVSVAGSKATVETTGFASDTVSAVDNTAPGYSVTLTTTPASGKFAVVMYEFANFV